ncbi:MAG: DNA mismatch repair protein MutS [Candidatus Eisenbacteria sp.]|nr:DNA mismatch repair protein MutS [Candidatus Eisenbacteria bacterium]
MSGSGESAGGRHRGHTPMMTQYLDLKDEVGDAILFYRMGDFYEMFFEDAETAARLCDLTLTSRNKSDPNPVPMAGVPWHSAEPYITRLLRSGRRVAVCEQIARPGGSGLMDRRIVEILTPGTALNDGLLEAGQNNYIAAVSPGDGVWGLALADISTGEFALSEVSPQRLPEELERLAPNELLIPRSLEGDRQLEAFLQEHPGIFQTVLDDWHFSRRRGRKTLTQHFKVASLEAFGVDAMDQGISAGGALLAYAKDQRKSPLGHLLAPRAMRESESLLLDESTLRNLEILEPLSGHGQHCLLRVLDQTRTPMGARALRRALARPLMDVKAIRARHDAVECLYCTPTSLDRMRELLRGIGDLERVLARLHAGRAGGRDLARLRDFLQPVDDAADIAALLNEGGRFPVGTQLDLVEELKGELARGLLPDPAVSSAGESIRRGYDEELDGLRSLAQGGREWIAQLQDRERAETGISTLKVGYNKVFGYYLEVTRTHLARVPERYQRKQTLVGAERFITPELKEQEEKILSADERAQERERLLLDQLKAQVLARTAEIQRIAAAVGQWDLFCSFAHRAREGRYLRPVVDESDRIRIVGGRHPVVERFLEGESFVPNDIDLDAQANQIQIITGPNMAGKSTFLRQVGLLVLMAQAGSFIPADEARIGVADRLFTRVGASDQIARGQSTFLVEMIETGRILHEATSRSLVLLDEIGRGTSTFDGLAIAWAVAEYLRERPLRRPRTLFATHFHELTQLARSRDGYKNLNVMVKEWKDEIIFVRRVTEGASDRSYGIQVARLAGLPGSVLDRARAILAELETGGPGDLPAVGGAGRVSQVQLFGEQSPSEPDGLWAVLEELDLDQLTPREALHWLYDQKSRCRKRET